MDSPAPPAKSLQKKLQAAMKAGERLQVEVFRMLLAAVKKTEIDSGKPVNKAIFVTIIQKFIKQRRESAVQYENAGRNELAARERAEVTILEPLLPPRDTAVLVNAVEAAIADCGATSGRDMGKVMAQLKSTLAGDDMSTISRLVKQKLSR